MTQWLIRPATADDLEGIVTVHIESWRETYSGLLPDEVIEANSVRAERTAMWAELLHPDNEATVLVGEADDRVVGFACAGPARDADAPADFEFWMLYTLQSTHGSGLGQALTDAVLGDREAYLWCLIDNSRGMAFHRRNGFVVDLPLGLRHGGGDVRLVRCVFGESETGPAVRIPSR